MRKILLILLLLAAVGPHRETKAQLNKAYFFYVGQNFLIDSKYQDAIEVLNILLRVDSSARIRFLRPPTSTAPSPVRGWAITTTP